MTFDDALGQMLFGGLVAYGHARDFHIDDDVAKFFADRGKTHIRKQISSLAEQYLAGVRAVEAIPRFFDRVELQMNEKKFPPLSGADTLVKDLQNSRLRSVWPFCTDLPWP